jgi:hypothetical protein
MKNSFFSIDAGQWVGKSALIERSAAAKQHGDMFVRIVLIVVVGAIVNALGQGKPALSQGSLLLGWSLPRVWPNEPLNPEIRTPARKGAMAPKSEPTDVTQRRKKDGGNALVRSNERH